MPLTHEDLDALKRPFATEEHSFKQKLVYLDEEAVCTRLDEVDPNWEPLIIERGYRPTADGSLVFSVHLRLTVCGVSRDGIGMSDIILTSNGKESNEAEKSAATDALKRAARLFGVGRYLLGTPDWVKDHDSLRKWLKGDSKPTQQSTPRNNQPTQPPRQVATGEKQVTLQTVTVKKSKENKPYLHFTTSDGTAVTAWSRQPFIDGFWITDLEWTQGTTQIKPPIPATLAPTPDGKYWNISSIAPMSDPFAEDGVS